MKRYFKGLRRILAGEDLRDRLLNHADGNEEPVSDPWTFLNALYNNLPRARPIALNLYPSLKPREIIIQPFEKTAYYMLYTRIITEHPTALLDPIDREGMLTLNYHLADTSISDALLTRINRLITFHNDHLKCEYLLQGDFLIRGKAEPPRSLAYRMNSQEIGTAPRRQDIGMIHDVTPEGRFRATFGPYQANYRSVSSGAFIHPIGGFIDATADAPGRTPLFVGYSWRPVHITLSEDTHESALFYIPVKAWQIL